MTTAFNNNIAYAEQLIEEFENICYFHGVPLNTPGINISDSKSVYGSWAPASRILSISRHLIESYPWQVVVEVLKHEMAHQYETDILKARPGHGPSFKTACRKLGVHDSFVRAQGDLSADMLDLTDTLSPEAERMIKKVEKLLSLATSDNEHEAQMASKKANDLIQKHNLDRLSPDRHGSQDPVTYTVITHKKKRVESLQKSILAILRDFYFVDTVVSSIYDARDLDIYKSIVLFGTRENLQVAEYVYHYLHRAAKNLWAENRKACGYTRKDKVSFDMGFTHGIRKNLEKIPSQEPAAGRDTSAVALTFKTLVAAVRQRNQAEIARVFPKLRKSSYGSHIRGAAYNNGYENGKSTLIKKGIHNKSAGTQGLLSH